MFVRLFQTRIRNATVVFDDNYWSKFRNEPLVQLLNDLDIDYVASYACGFDLDTYCVEYTLVIPRVEDRMVLKMHMGEVRFYPMSEFGVVRQYMRIARDKRLAADD